MILIIDNQTSYLGNLKKLLKNKKVKYILKNQKSFLKKVNKNKIRGIILTGGGPDLDRKIKIDRIRADISTIINYNVPLLGICEGFQIIAQVFGGDVKRLKKPSINKKNKITLLTRTKIFKGLSKQIEAYEFHKNYITSLPEEFKITATSKKDKIEAFFHKKRPIFAVSFHPEETKGLGEKIINNFLEICYKKV